MKSKIESAPPESHRLSRPHKVGMDVPRLAGVACVTLLVFLQGSPAAADPLAVLNGRVTDARTGTLLPARVSIRDSAGEWFFPRCVSAEGTAVDYQRNRKGSPAMHTTLSADPFMVRLPPGKYTVTAQRGKEYFPVEREVVVDTDSTDIVLPLVRWIHMARLGWYSGDTHSHRSLAETPNLVLAEDLNLSFPLSHWVSEGRVSPVKGNRVLAPAPQPEPIKIDDDHLVYPLNTEYELGGIGGRPHALGAVLIIGHKTLFHQGAPPVGPVAEQAHREGALLDFEKHSWSWSLMLAPVMQVDLFELSNNHVWPGPFQLGKWTFGMNPAYMRVATDQNGYTEWGWIDYGFQTYYALLNCGFRIQPTAGTGSGAHPVPLGFGRVYVQQPDGFSYENWIKELKAGRSFVTTGPMLLATVNGRPAGHVFVSASTGDAYRVAGRVESRYRVDRVEIVVNGLVVRTLTPRSERAPEEGFRTPFSADVSLAGSGWIAVRTFTRNRASRIRFAHTSPWHVEVADHPLKPRAEEVDYIVRHLDRELRRHRGVLEPASLAEFKAALDFYRELEVNATAN
jgi:hypothetical protein